MCAYFFLITATLLHVPLDKLLTLIGQEQSGRQPSNIIQWLKTNDNWKQMLCFITSYWSMLYVVTSLSGWLASPMLAEALPLTMLQSQGCQVCQVSIESVQPIGEHPWRQCRKFELELAAAMSKQTPSSSFFPAQLLCMRETALLWFWQSG